MEYCVVADFEWAVTPHACPGTGRFLYLNEILSFGAVRFDRTGHIADRFYSLVRPDYVEYLHPVVLESLKLNRSELAEALPFSEVFSEFLSYVDGSSVFTWGGSDESALKQNERLKGSAGSEPGRVPPMFDIQPFICRSLGVSKPYPGLGTVLRSAGLDSPGLRHNALSDAEDTVRILRMLADRKKDALSFLFSREPGRRPGFPEPSSCIRSAKRDPVDCPVCRKELRFVSWNVLRETDSMGVCLCREHGKFLYRITAEKRNDGYFPVTALRPYSDPEFRDLYDRSRYRSVNRR